MTTGQRKAFPRLFNVEQGSTVARLPPKQTSERNLPGCMLFTDYRAVDRAPFNSNQVKR
jgi:hypothetical protein